MTHEYTLLLNCNVIPGGDAPEAAAIAWAEGVILAIGREEEVLAISRGDSARARLAGAFVIPLGRGEPRWPTEATLEVGGNADLAVLADDPRNGHPTAPLAIVRSGHVVQGSLPISAPAARAAPRE